MDGNNPLKRQTSCDDFEELLDSGKRKKIALNHSSSGDTHSPLYALSVPHLPPSLPTNITDLPLPSLSSLSVANLIPTLKRFTISTKQPQSTQQKQQWKRHRQGHQLHDLPDYTSINQILHDAHMERLNPHANSACAMDYYCGDINSYSKMNMVIRQAYLQRHSVQIPSAAHFPYT